jgi:hypothetical protein
VSKSAGLRLRMSHADVMRWQARIMPTSTCHVWMGAVGSDGYGRFSIRNELDGERMLTPHQVAARLAFGPLPVGSTVMHDCDVRVCVSTAAGHVRVATQQENMWQAARRGRAAGPRPGLVDVRGKVGASRAVQDAITAAGTTDPAALAVVLADCLAVGDPLREWFPLFDLPAGPPSVVRPWDDFPADLFAVPPRPASRSAEHQPSLF